MADNKSKKRKIAQKIANFIVNFSNNSTDRNEILIFLMAVSGKKIVEILKFGKFQKADNDTYIKYTGFNTTYEMPILVKNAIFLKYIKFIRNDTDLDLTAEEIRSKYDEKINLEIKQKLNVTIQDLYDVYNKIVYSKYASTDKLVYTKRILGQSSYESALFYMNVNLT
jgi:hypothetical protein